MAILKKEDFFNRLTGYIGDSNSDDDISFFEDMTDTYNDLERRKAGDGVDWEQKFKDNDEAWRKKYRNRFFRGDAGDCFDDDMNDGNKNNDVTPDNITFDDIFRKREG